MYRNNINYLLVGTLVIAMGVSLMVVLFQLTGRSENTDTYFTVFDNITNIQQGSTVTYSGYPVGYVQHIEPRREAGITRYHLALGVRQGWMIPTDSYAKIYTPGMLADTMIDIVEGRQDSLLDPGATLASRESPELMSLIGETAGEIKNLSTDQIQPLLASLHEVINRLGARMETSITDISGETLALLDHLDRVGTTMDSNMQQLSQGTGQLLDSLQQNSRDLSQFMNAENAGHITQVLENADHISHELATTVNELAQTRQILNRLMQETSTLISDNRADIRDSVEDTQHTMQTISNNIESIVYQLDNTSRNMNEFSRRIRENPGTLIQDRPPKDLAE